MLRTQDDHHARKERRRLVQLKLYGVSVNTFQQVAQLELRAKLGHLGLSRGRTKTLEKQRDALLESEPQQHIAQATRGTLERIDLGLEAFVLPEHDYSSRGRPSQSATEGALLMASRVRAMIARPGEKDLPCASGQ